MDGMGRDVGWWWVGVSCRMCGWLFGWFRPRTSLGDHKGSPLRFGKTSLHSRLFLPSDGLVEIWRRAEIEVVLWSSG